ncbi:hypothetical protein Back2_17690 [Nocardioides baekrokdamisoli]|uniref:ParB-like N-terminal domain-containing protein n=1 Tax=Nocardioides baekrokdamisoli TaxID=1804624 RepID=A0A3G9IH11_9ACTN|nr:ParB/RepB/Spo0J family partition protein [Nocardioides baekrokdamisoli]BBH17482.1 hypothetical protein Back2_17690 [Nocardioides baekrokdamisoli]
MTTTATDTPKIIINTPPGTQAGILERVLNAPHPRIALPEIAHHFDMSLADLQTLLNYRGYPNPGAMRSSVTTLRSLASPSAPPDRVNAIIEANEQTTLVRVAVADLQPDPSNLREDVHGRSPDSNGTNRIDDIEQLADSIREVGLLQPIVVRRTGSGRLVVVAGHRRLAAIQRLRWTDVDVIVRPPMRPDDVIAAMLIENGQRRDLDPIEEARGIRRLKAEHHMTDIELARKIGRSQSYVSARLALLNLTPQEQEGIRSGELTLGGATNLGRLNAGKVRHGSKGNISIAHYGPTHELASRATARCKRLGHTHKLAGGVACGPCWESVIRADERDHLQELNAHRTDCVTCGEPIDQNHAAEL